MTDQSYAGPNTPLWLSNFGVERVAFNKLAAPPLSRYGKGVLYELEDGILYFNGVPLSGGGGDGDVSSSISSTLDNKVCRFDSTTGKLIQDSNLIIEDGSSDSVVLSGRIGSQTLPLVLATDSTQKTTLGLRTPADSSLGIGSTAIGNGAMQLSTGATNCTAVGADALFQCSGQGNVALGAAAGLQYAGTEHNNIVIDSPGILGENYTIRIGDNHTRCFIKGIYGATGAGASDYVKVDADGQLTSGTLPASGDVVGPAGATDNAVALYNSTTGKLIKNSSLLYTLNTNAPRFDVSGWENLLFTQANHSQFMGYKSGNTFVNSQLGTNNCGFGPSCLQAHTGGSDNTAVGSFAMFSKTNQLGNTAVGSSSLQNLASGSGVNTAVGSGSLSGLASGTGNCCLGQGTGSSYTTSESNNICLGTGVNGVSAESGVIRIGTSTQDRCFIARELKSYGATLRLGNQSGLALVDTNNTSGCTLLGNQTGINSSTFTNVTAVGNFAARYCTANSNTVVGSGALSGISATGANNAILGYNCAPATTSAQGNVICGTNGGVLLTTGSTNTILGNSAAGALTTSSNNIIIGATAGGTLATGTGGNIYIGANAGSATEATTTRIGTSQTSCSIAGISGATSTGGVAVLVNGSGILGTISSSQVVKENIRDIVDTSFLYDVELRNFEYIAEEVDPITGLKTPQVGVIAEQIEQLPAAAELNLVLLQGNGVKTVDYHKLFVCALRELQKINQRVAVLEANEALAV